MRLICRVHAHVSLCYHQKTTRDDYNGLYSNTHMSLSTILPELNRPLYPDFLAWLERTHPEIHPPSQLGSSAPYPRVAINNRESEIWQTMFDMGKTKYDGVVRRAQNAAANPQQVTKKKSAVAHTLAAARAKSLQIPHFMAALAGTPHQLASLAQPSSHAGMSMHWYIMWFWCRFAYISPLNGFAYCIYFIPAQPRPIQSLLA